MENLHSRQSSSQRLMKRKCRLFRAEASPVQKPFVVFDLPRAGALMVAQLIETLGVVMVSKLPSDYRNNEFNCKKTSDKLMLVPL